MCISFKCCFSSTRINMHQKLHSQGKWLNVHFIQVLLFQHQDQHASKTSQPGKWLMCISFKCCFSGTRINMHQKLYSQWKWLNVHFIQVLLFRHQDQHAPKTSQPVNMIKCAFHSSVAFPAPGSTCTKKLYSQWKWLNVHFIQVLLFQHQDQQAPKTSQPGKVIKCAFHSSVAFPAPG